MKNLQALCTSNVGFMLMLLSVFLPHLAPENVALGQASPIRVIPQKVEFGVVAPSTSHVAQYTVINTSSKPVQIVAAKPSCKCTNISGIEGVIIPPGERVEFNATMKAPSTPGIKDAKVYLMLNGQQQPVIAQMTADVTHAIRAEPPFVDALKGATSGQIRLTSVDGKPFQILASSPKYPQFVGFTPGQDEPRNNYIIQWNIKGLPPAMLPLWWVVATDRDDCPVIPLRIRNENTGSRRDMARYERFWIFDENIVDAGKLNPGKPVLLSTEIEHYNPRQKGQIVRRDFRDVMRVKSLAPNAATAELVKVESVGDSAARITFRFTPSATFTGLLYVDVAVTTATGTGSVPVVALVQQ